MGKLREVASSKSGHDRDHRDDHDDDGVFRCTSQIMIMRHCDKEVEVDVHGRRYTTDVMDGGGNGHCSATGVARSEYIATLFVDPYEYRELVGGKGGREEHDDDGRVPPVPMVKSSLSRVSKVASSTKPQFPTPIKLYALAAERDGSRLGHRGHMNFREIETITPLSRKFRMDVDDRFGVGDEGDLAADYFGMLADGVVEKYRARMTEGGGKRKREDEDDREDDGEALLCDRGMTVVNWKHSRIPQLARALGCGVGQGCPRRYNGKDFDTMWLLTFQYTAMLGSTGGGGGGGGHRARDGMDELESETLSALFGTKSSASGRTTTRTGGRVLRRGGGGGGGGGDAIGTWKIKAEMVNEGFYPV
ncbi:hypothetical protein ACHAW5_003721 [Stephanodiscus triporus]|uniref:Uncharacterized protein n=1 Tax=Stephanodiscus triporus TaxID=2934178 RepID=A0ABD3NSY9_9STRA